LIAADNSDDQIVYTSPDGLLVLLITPDVEGETMVSFHGFEWAIAGSELPGAAENLDLAIKDYVASVMDDSAIIAVLMQDGEMTDVWITEDPESDIECNSSDESILFRRWSGAVVSQPE